MIQEVNLQGISLSPSDNICQDGELSACLNLIPEAGSLHPIPAPHVAEPSIIIPDGDTIELVHKVTHRQALHSHYIVRKSDDTWYWLERGGDGTAHPIDLSGFHVNSVAVVGNILCFVGDSKTLYCYWKDEQYFVMDLTTIKYSGSIKREAGPRTYDVIEPNDAVSGIDSHLNDNPRYFKFKDDINATAAQKLFLSKDAYLNSSMDDNSFKYIQFGVLAVKLYDGSYLQVGNPFTITNGDGTDNNIYLWYTLVDGKTKVVGEGQAFSYSKHTMYAVHLAQTLFKFQFQVNFPDISKYEDIIEGVDVFVSNSIYPYKTNVSLNEPQKMVDNWTDDTLVINTEKYGTITLRNAFIIGAGEMFGHWSYPSLSKEEMNEEIGKLLFYKSISFSYDDIVNGKKKYLKRITQAEETISLADNQRASLGAKVAMTYNNRLHLANVGTKYDSIVNGYVSSEANTAQVVIHAKYKKNGQTYDTYSITDIGFPIDPLLSFNSDNVVLFELYTNYNNKYKKFDFYNQSNLGISFYVEYTKGKLSSIDLKDGTAITTEQWQEILEKAKTFDVSSTNYQSLIKVSEAENPLVFPAKNSVQVGSSIINALAANTRPISEGQFGDAPLYAFTDEGVWILMFDATGTYQARQPANREICSNPKGILQLDDAILFPTERGIMLQQGRECTCITDGLDGYPFNVFSLHSEAYMKKLLALDSIPESDVQSVRFRDYLQSADMIFDYYDSRIIVFNPTYTYAYVYSMKSKLWGMMHNFFLKRVNIYPEAYAVNAKGQILDVHVKNPTADVSYFLCTRPLKLGSSEVHKTMFTSIARGYFRSSIEGKCAVILYGSNDLIHWYYIGSSANRYLRGMAGSPFKYFRIVLQGSLSPDETISSISTEFQPRWQNKLR